MAITKEQVLHVAKLARIEVDEQSIDSISRDMAAMVAMVEEINQLDTSKLEPLLSVQDSFNVMREDVPGQPLPIQTIEKLAPKFEAGHIVVPAVIE